MWYLGVCEGHQGLVSVRATGGTHTLQRRQANGHRCHLSLWTGRTSAVAVFVLRKLSNSKLEPVRFLGTFMPNTVMGRGHCMCHRGETLHPNQLSAAQFSSSTGPNANRRGLRKHILYKFFESLLQQWEPQVKTAMYSLACIQALPRQPEAQEIKQVSWLTFYRRGK